jgi:uncharacterized membrane protein
MMARLNSGERDLEIVKFGKARLALRVHHHHRPYHIALLSLLPPHASMVSNSKSTAFMAYTPFCGLTTRRLILQNGAPFLLFFFFCNFILIQLYNFYTGAFKENGAVFPEHRQISR